MWTSTCLTGLSIKPLSAVFAFELDEGHDERGLVGMLKTQNDLG
jgi:hypothetical protein